jgi:hypothetical protein
LVSWQTGETQREVWEKRGELPFLNSKIAFSSEESFLFLHPVAFFFPFARM